MTEDRFAGTAKNIGGQVEEGFGRNRRREDAGRGQGEAGGGFPAGFLWAGKGKHGRHCGSDPRKRQRSR